MAHVTADPDRLTDEQLCRQLGWPSLRTDTITFGRWGEQSAVHRDGDGLWSAAALAPFINQVRTARRRGARNANRVRGLGGGRQATRADRDQQVAQQFEVWGDGPTAATRWCIQRVGIAPYCAPLAVFREEHEARAALRAMTRRGH